jgi:hypothetical protein
MTMTALARFGRRAAPPRSRRRWSAAAVCAVLVGALGSYYIASAAAAGTTTIQNNNALELDGNATPGNGSSAVPPVPNAVDWQNVYCTTNPGAAGCSGVAPDGAKPDAFVTDPFNNLNDDIFTTGGSKDPNAVASWAWTGSKPQAKDDIEHAYAAEYAAATVCSDSALTTNCVNHQVLFLGADRYSNGGNSNIGFWFFKGKVAKTGATSGGFTGNHTNGDLLVLSAFLNGGVVPQVAVYQWFCPAAATAAQCAAAQSSGNPNGGVLSLITSSNGADCVNGVDTKGNPVPAVFGDVCATVNTIGVTAPWPYTEKSSDGGTAGQFGPGTFFEGGLDLTNLGFGNTCFSSFLAETRSSQSTTATLSDFTGGTFQRCSAAITTSQSASAPVSPGTQVTDTATVTGSGPTTPPFPTSSTDPSVSGAPGTPVSFGTCFSATQISSCNGLTVTAFDTQNLQNSSTQGVSTATSKAFDTTGKTPGFYCFTASWGGDQNYVGTISDDGSVGTPGGNGECFQVRQIPTVTITTPSDGSGNALSGAQPFGTMIFDLAVVTASLSGEGRPTGTVSFSVCNPGQTTTDASGTFCAAGNGSLVTPDAVPLKADPSNPLASDALSGGTPANMAGTWCFRATYTPDTTAFIGGTETNPTTECVVISKAPTTTKTTPVDVSGHPLGSTITLTSPSGVTVYDQALITGVPNGGPPTGTVAFSICGPVSTASCDASQVPPFDPSETVGNFSTDAQGRPTGTAMSTGTVVTQVGTYCFYAKYSSSSANYFGSDDPNDPAECFTVKDTSAATSAQDWLPNDSATFTTAGGNPLNGSVTFSLFSDGSCGASGGTALYNEPAQTLTNATGSGSGTTLNTTNGSNPATTVKVKASATVSWLVNFASTDSNVASSSHCESTSLTITN